jgi:hypothetical protein
VPGRAKEKRMTGKQSLMGSRPRPGHMELQ